MPPNEVSVDENEHCTHHKRLFSAVTLWYPRGYARRCFFWTHVQNKQPFRSVQWECTAGTPNTSPKPENYFRIEQESPFHDPLASAGKGAQDAEINGICWPDPQQEAGSSEEHA
jgi:hypothetical protein